MFIDLNQYVHVLTELKITANQFLLCYLLYTDEKTDGKYEKKGKSIANLYKYATISAPWTKSEVRDLVDKGYLIDPHYKNPNDTYPDQLKVTDKFCRLIFTLPTAFDELNKLFPFTVANFVNPTGPRIKLKVCDLYVMKELYHSKVKTIIKHKEVLSLVQWAIDNGELNFNFENFIRGELWNTLRELRNNSNENNIMHGKAAR